MPTPTTVVTINGSPVDLTTGDIVPTKLHLAFRAIDTFTYQVRGGAVPSPDPYLGKPCTVAINGTTYFRGTISRRDIQREAIGYLFSYTSLGLRDKGDWVPLTDPNTGTDVSSFNLDPTDPNYLASRAGRNVGQILTSVLTGTDNANALSALGIGNYTFPSGTPTLPSSTVSDLAALTVIPPYPCYVQGERLLGAIESFLLNVLPNHALWVQPSDGALRFLDMRTFAAHTFTLGSDLVEPVTFTRDVTDCFQRVVVRGQPQILPLQVSLAEGSLAEDFAWGTFNNAQAKTDWTPAKWSQPGTAQDQGTCTCTTTTVTVTSSSSSTFWSSNFWDQTSTGAHGVIYLDSSAASGTIQQKNSRRIVSNTALTAGGTSVLTLDYPLPITTYGTYWIHGDTIGSNIVWRKYSIVNTAIGAKMQNFFNFPVPWINSSSASLIESYSTPVSSICYSSSGTPPYTEVPLQFTCDPTTSTILFLKPTSLVFGGGTTTTPPSDIRVLLAVAVDSLTAIEPPNSGSTPVYQGTSYTQDGMQKTKTVTIDAWKDPVNATAMLAYAQELLDSVKDAVVEGSVVYYDLYEPALTFGVALNVTGSTYTTGWENCTSFGGHPGLPVQEVELEWSTDARGPMWTTILSCSNRRAFASAEDFLRPDRTFLPFGTESGTFSPLGGYQEGGFSAATPDQFSQDRLTERLSQPQAPQEEPTPPEPQHEPEGGEE